jgi:hypothetical protein
MKAFIIFLTKLKDNSIEGNQGEICATEPYHFTFV